MKAAKASNVEEGEEDAGTEEAVVVEEEEEPACGLTFLSPLSAEEESDDEGGLGRQGEARKACVHDTRRRRR